MQRMMQDDEIRELGRVLKEAREAKKITLVQAALALKLRQKYLSAIEEGRAGEIAQDVYVAGCVRSYARWLGVELTNRNIAISRHGRLPRAAKQAKHTGVWAALLFIPFIGFRWPKRSLAVFSLCLTLLAYGIWYVAEYASRPQLPDPLVFPL